MDVITKAIIRISKDMVLAIIMALMMDLIIPIPIMAIDNNSNVATITIMAIREVITTIKEVTITIMDTTMDTITDTIMGTTMVAVIVVVITTTTTTITTKAMAVVTEAITMVAAMVMEVVMVIKTIIIEDIKKQSRMSFFHYPVFIFYFFIQEIVQLYLLCFNKE